ncbi:hypothetical protein [Streptomyces inhibens]|nr:hypothetical protein [Streptomyces inhibens]
MQQGQLVLRPKGAHTAPLFWSLWDISDPADAVFGDDHTRESAG